MPVANVNAVIQDTEGYMWYATYEGGICRDNGYQIDVFRKDKDHPDLISDNVIYCLCEAPNGEIWFSTVHSVYVLDKHTYGIRPLSDAFRSISAQRIDRLDNGNMQVAADTMVYEVSVDGQILAAHREKYKGRKVMVQPDGEGGYWICHADKELCYAEGNTNQVVRKYDVAAKNILVDRSRHLLFAITREGLQVFQIDKSQLGDCIYCYREIPELGVYGLYLDTRGNLWMTGYQPSFTLFTPQPEGSARKLNIGSPLYGEVYVDRLVPLGHDRLAVFKDVDYLSEYNIATDKEILLSSDTVSPPYSWKNDKLLASMKTLPDIDTLLVKDATVDGRGHLWVVFDQYVREINTKTGRQRDIQCSMVNEQWSMNNFCCITAISEGVCVGGAGGVCYLASNPRLDNEKYDVPTSISSYDVTTDNGQVEKGFVYAGRQLPTLRIGHDCTCLTLYLTSFNHVNAPKTRFAVKVEGGGDNWVYMAPGENVFRMLNLPKGQYRIWLRATDADGLWGDEHEVLVVRRLPAWWESWWAYTCYVLLVLACLVGAFFLYRYVQQKREQFDNMLRLLNNGSEETNRHKEEVTDNGEERQAITQPKAPEPEQPSLNSEFRDKAIAAVKANMDNESYTVDMMADALCMSRVNLYRRMMTVCGQTPSDFIKTLRMEQAYHLLSTTDLPVNIVAGKCGFTSSSYFAKCFKARFGVLPTAMRSS